MAETREYHGRNGFNLRCATCDTDFPVGFERLGKAQTLECYQCGATVAVTNAIELVRLARQAQVALQALHDEMDVCPVHNSVTLLGDCRMMRVRRSR